MRCPHCGEEISDDEVAKYLGQRGGKVKSEAKAKASRENGKKGGRPRKNDNDK